MNTHHRPAAWLIITRIGPRLLPVILLASLLAGCGQKGPLRLPDETFAATQQK